ncbi:MAG: hypothetical protein V1867_00065 [Candidatus Falkowbacteria bacterium]
MEKIKLKLSADLKNAMKEKNILIVKTIRFLMSAIDNAGTVAVETPKIIPAAGGIAGATDGLFSTEVPRKILSDKDIKNIIQREIDEIEKAIESIKDPSRPETGQYKEQINILKKYL